jgi:phosphate transport system substrate-binding protein
MKATGTGEMKRWIAATVLGAAFGVLGQTPPSQKKALEPGASTEGLDMQAARAKMMSARGAKVAYTKQFDLSGLPKYEPKHKLKGTLRVWGSNYITDGKVGSYWEAAFRKLHPGVKIEWNMKTTSAAVPSLVFGVSDLGIGRKLTFQEQQLFERYRDRAPLEIEIATGSFDVPGWQPGFGVVVHKDNPLENISMEQLDGIFGAERQGGWEGTSWRPQWVRGAEKNIRIWGQLGVRGEWADKPINPYGLTLRYHQATEISDRVLKASDKWNERLRIYANFVSKEGALERGLNEDLAQDRYGVGILAAPTTTLRGVGSLPTLKVLPLAWKDGGPYVPYTLETVQDRSYPLFDHIFAYFDREPGKPMNPAVYEFVKFIVSREGQAEVMRDAKYLPLTAEVATEQLKRLERWRSN